MRILLSLQVLSTLVMVCHANASPCDGISRHLDEERKTELKPILAQQLGVQEIDVLQSFKLGSWSILYVDPHEADEAFLFFSDDPKTSHYLNLWSGAARRDEGKKIRNWVIKNVSGIPDRLARCFAWHVTQDRDM